MLFPDIKEAVRESFDIDQPLSNDERSRIAASFKSMVINKSKPNTPAPVIDDFLLQIDFMVQNMVFGLDPINFNLDLKTMNPVADRTMQFLERGTAWFSGFNRPLLVENAVQALFVSGA